MGPAGAAALLRAKLGDEVRRAEAFPPLACDLCTSLRYSRFANSI